ncbi:hypothetical protein [Nocardia sp. NPDC052566]|uniref:hypothetical protein n=1 Tax=Nocardia sp. NPDC052566 TaxID=3364330 RepID=UPI0037C9DDA2
MFRSRYLSVLAGVAIGWGIVAAPVSAQTPASITVGPTLKYEVATLGIGGSATCDGGGTAGVNVLNGSLEQMFEGGIGGPMAIQLDGPVLVDCDGSAHPWSGNIIAPGRVLPNSSGGSVTVTLTQGSSTIATTGPQPIHIVG